MHISMYSHLYLNPSKDYIKYTENFNFSMYFNLTYIIPIIQ